MSDIPKLRKSYERRNINIVVDKKIDDIYRLAKQNGYNSSELVRQAVSRLLLDLEPQLKRPVG